MKERLTALSGLRVRLVTLSAIIFIIAVGYALFHLSDARAEQDSRKLRIVYIPFGTGQETLAKYKPFTDYMSRNLGMEVEAFSSDSHDEVILKLHKGEFDLAYLSPLTYVEAVMVANLEVVAQEMYDIERAGYRSILIKMPENQIQEGEAVLAYTNPHSTSGFLMPQVYFNEVLKKPDNLYAKKIVFAGDHKSVVAGVLEGKYDLGFSNDADLDVYVKEGLVKKDALEILWKSDLIPGSPLCLNPAIDPALKNRIKNSILGLEPGSAVLKEINVAGYKQSTADDYKVMFKLKAYAP